MGVKVGNYLDCIIDEHKFNPILQACPLPDLCKIKQEVINAEHEWADKIEDK